MSDEGKIFVGQTKLRLTVLTDEDLTDATVFQIKYKKPDDDTEYIFTATCDDKPKGEIFYDFVTDDLDARGLWTFWSYITFAANVVPGESFTVMIYDEGE